VIGLIFKLAIGPALILLVFAGVLGAEGQVLKVTVFETDDRREYRRAGS
jgi:malate permease and related proteins